MRAGRPGFSPRTQSSSAVSADGERFLLVNASPDLRQQIAASPRLWPREGGPSRASPIEAVALTNGDVDHIAGLLTLRERQALAVYGSARVLANLAQNPVFDVLAADVVARRDLALGVATPIFGSEASLGLSVEAFAVPGKIALYLEDAAASDFGTSEGDTVGLRIVETATGKGFYYVPGCAAFDASLAGRLTGADLVFFDGTLWSEREMLEQGLMTKTGSRMGHMNMSGADGSLAAFAALAVRTKVYVHINNSNPVLNAASPQRAQANAAGWLIGEDGMGFEL